MIGKFISWRVLFPWVIYLALIDGFFANLLFPFTFPLLVKDFLAVAVYLLFLSTEPVGPWLKAFRDKFGKATWLLAMAFLMVGFLQLFNPNSPGFTLGLLGFRVTFLYWPLGFIAFVYVENFDKALAFMKKIALISVPINIFGYIQFLMGPMWLVSTFGYGFMRTNVMAHIPGERHDTFFRIIGTFGSSGQYSVFLMLNLVFCLVLLLVAQKLWSKVFWTACGVMTFMALLATGTRSIMLMTVISLVLFGALSRRARPMIAAAFLVGFGLYASTIWLNRAVYKRVQSIRHESNIQRTVAAPQMFMNSLNDYPMGRGLGVASTAARYLSKYEGAKDRILVENNLTKLQVEMGLAGVLIFYCFLIALMMQWVQDWLKYLDEYRAMIVIPLTGYGLTICLFMGTLFGVFDTPPIPIFFWTVVGTVMRLSLNSEVAAFERARAAEENAESESAGMARS